MHLAADVVDYYVAGDLNGPAGAAGPTGPSGPADVSANPPRILHVAKGGGQFTSVSAALASITGASASNRFVVQVAPGVYDETPH